MSKAFAALGAPDDDLVYLPKWGMFTKAGKAKPPRRRSVLARGGAPGSTARFEVFSAEGWSGATRTKKWWICGGLYSYSKSGFDRDQGPLPFDQVGSDNLSYRVCMTTSVEATAMRWVEAVKSGRVRFKGD